MVLAAPPVGRVSNYRWHWNMTWQQLSLVLHHRFYSRYWGDITERGRPSRKWTISDDLMLLNSRTGHNNSFDFRKEYARADAGVGRKAGWGVAGGGVEREGRNGNSFNVQFRIFCCRVIEIPDCCMLKESCRNSEWGQLFGFS